MTKYAEAAERLTDINAFLEKSSIPPPRTEFTSNIGEWLVMDELLNRGFFPALKSGQNDVDIVLADDRGIEVKSAVKSDRLGGVWSFDRIDPSKFDFLVCVKLSENYSDAEYFVFGEDEIGAIPPRNMSAFSNPAESDNRRLLHILENLDGARSEKERHINERIDEFLEAWHKI